MVQPRPPPGQPIPAGGVRVRPQAALLALALITSSACRPVSSDM